MTGPVTGADRPGRMRRGAARFAVLLVVCLGAGLGLAGPAAAHNVLIASDPADGAVLQQSPTVISLTFDQPVQDFQPVVTVLGADGQRYESGTPSVDSTVVTQSVTTLTAPGPYSIAYRVVSADGHPVQGEVRFELAAAAGELGRVQPSCVDSCGFESRGIERSHVGVVVVGAEYARVHLGRFDSGTADHHHRSAGDSGRVVVGTLGLGVGGNRGRGRAGGRRQSWSSSADRGHQPAVRTPGDEWAVAGHCRRPSAPLWQRGTRVSP